LAGQLGDVAPDVEATRGEIDVRPAKTDDFASTKPGLGDDAQHGLDPGRAAGVEEPLELIMIEDALDGLLAVMLRSRDPKAEGGVRADVPPLDRGAEH